MSLRLRNNLHWCNCGGRVVLLDTQADRYLCLSQSANHAFLRLASHEMQPNDVEQLTMLVARGMLIEAGAEGRIEPPPIIEVPTCDFVPDPLTKLGPTRVLRGLASELGVARMLRTKPLCKAIDTVRTRRRRGLKLENSSRSTREIVSASAAVALLMRSHNRCLVRALAVYTMCRDSGRWPKLVFGVIAHPFTAHCWVQLGSAVLVGGYEQARLYTPILVVE